jgi:ribulose-bisphosphate carboxylase large chain
MNRILGCGDRLRRDKEHPYLGRVDCMAKEQRAQLIAELNRSRGTKADEAVEVRYFYEVWNEGQPGQGLFNAAKMLLEHGTIKPWQEEGDRRFDKPVDYDKNMNWVTDIQLFGHNQEERIESGTLSIAYPLHFFDKRSSKEFPLAQFMTAVAGEPFAAFSFFQSARIIHIHLPPSMSSRFPGPRWPHRRIREYLGLKEQQPIIGTIVKPKAGLTPALFSRCVVEAAFAGAHFTKGDENFHLRLEEVPQYVGRVVQDLRNAGFDLSRSEKPRGRRFIFAPHITADGDRIMDYAQAALEAGANALMFSPYYGGGFVKMSEIAERFDIPIYSHAAGMNVLTGSHSWGFDSKIMYFLAAAYGASFMQITAVNGYLKPEDSYKEGILEFLREHRLEGDSGMTLAIAGGLSPKNVGINLKLLGEGGRMLLAGTSVYSHPGGPQQGVRALILAYQGYKQRGITDTGELAAYAKELGTEGEPLLQALRK